MFLVTLFTFDLVNLKRNPPEVQQSIRPTYKTFHLSLRRNLSTIDHSYIESGSECEAPSISSGQLHIIVAGHDNARQSDYQYLSDFGLSNAIIFPYIRRPGLTFALDTVSPCGMQFHPRYMLPNHGREGSAFFDYAIEHYHNPPELLIFLHGHQAVSWHTTCNALFSRMLLAYRMLARGEDLNRMVTLTANPFNSSDPYKWYGRSRKLLNEKQLHEEAACKSFMTEANITMRGNSNHMSSCCASFIFPGIRLTWYPLSFYRNIKTFLLNTTLNDQMTGRYCFEFIVYNLFSENYSSDQDWIDEKLFYNISKNLLSNEPILKNRLGKCYIEAKKKGFEKSLGLN